MRWLSTRRGDDMRVRGDRPPLPLPGLLSRCTLGLLPAAAPPLPRAITAGSRGAPPSVAGRDAAMTCPINASNPLLGLPPYVCAPPGPLWPGAGLGARGEAPGVIRGEVGAMLGVSKPRGLRGWAVTAPRPAGPPATSAAARDNPRGDRGAPADWGAAAGWRMCCPCAASCCLGCCTALWGTADTWAGCPRGLLVRLREAPAARCSCPGCCWSW